MMATVRRVSVRVRLRPLFHSRGVHRAFGASSKRSVRRIDMEDLMASCGHGDCGREGSGGCLGTGRQDASGGCFPASALVSTPGGLRRIVDVSVGEDIFSWSPNGGMVPRRVTVVKRYSPQQVLRLVVASGRALCVTGHHTMLSQRGWVRVRSLRVGDSLTNPFDGLEQINAVELLPKAEPVFNLTTSGEHTFIVDGFVAHNFTELRKLRTLLHRNLVDPFYEGLWQLTANGRKLCGLTRVC